MRKYTKKKGLDRCLGLQGSNCSQFYFYSSSCDEHKASVVDSGIASGWIPFEKLFYAAHLVLADKDACNFQVRL